MTFLRRPLLWWVFSRTRWSIDVVVEAAFGIVFFALPYSTMAFLGVERSDVAAVLFRLYGIVIVARAFYHDAIFRGPEPRTVLRGLAGDFLFTSASAVVLISAIHDKLAGPATWLIVAQFVLESIFFATIWMGLRTATSEEFRRALLNSRDQ